MGENRSREQLLLENEKLRRQLEEANETLRAIRSGEVDALVVCTEKGEQVFTLRGAEATYRIMIEEMSEGAVVLSEDGFVLYCNAGFAGMMKSSIASIIGVNIQDFISPSKKNFQDLIQAERTGKKKIGAEIIFQRGDGTVFPGYVSVNPLPIDKMKTAFLIVADLTEHKEQERLVTIGQLAGMVGHDIRNPLQSIEGILYLSRAELDSGSFAPKAVASMKEMLDALGEQTAYINKIVSDLQDYAKALKPELDKVNLQQLIDDSLNMISKPENIDLSVTVEEDAAIIVADPTMMKRLLTNLVVNAIQAMPQGGKLTISASNKEENVCITVKDTGVGIPEELKPKIFIPMFSTKSKGQGLGLAVCKRMVEAHDGKITFESRVGEGTTFTVRIPSPK